MSVTLDDVVKLQHQHLNTIGSKLVYLIIQNNEDETGWASITLREFEKLTTLSRRGVTKLLARLASVGVIEICRNRSETISSNRYRVIKP